MEFNRKRAADLLTNQSQQQNIVLKLIKESEEEQSDTLDLASFGLTEIPPEIGKLTNLKLLFLQDNFLTFLPPEIGNLKNLQLLYLHGNLLEELPYEFVKLKELEEFRCEDNSEIKNPPPEIIERGLDDINSYLTARNEAVNEEVAIYEAKLIVVGQGGVGKTCLCKRLTADAYKGGEERTKGISINNWTPSPPPGKPEISINLWDFGGQEIYHATHQFFLTKRSVYLIVWDARQEDEYGRLDYWLHTVESFGLDSPIILVLNKCDEDTQDINLKTLKNKFPQIVRFFKISCKSPEMGENSFEELRSEIYNVTSTLPLVGAKWIKSWFEVRAILQEDQRNQIDLREYLSLCRKHRINEKQALTLSKYLHDLGIILHFQSDPLLKHTIILKPEWATTAVYKVIDNNSTKKNYGLLLESNLEQIWKEEDGLPTNKHETLLRLMCNFDLCFRIQDQNNYIVPQLLKTEPPPNFSWPYQDNLEFYYFYSFMPPGVLPRFIVRFHQEISTDSNNNLLCWREGIVIDDDSSKALVTVNYSEKKLEIRVIGSRRKEMLHRIRKEIYHINKSIKKINFRLKIPCRCSPKCNYLFDYNTLLKAEEKKKKFLICGETVEDVNIELLLNGVEHKSKREGGNLIDEIPAKQYTNQKGSTINIYRDIIYHNESISSHNVRNVEVKDFNDISEILQLLKDDLLGVKGVPPKIIAKAGRAVDDAIDEANDKKGDSQEIINSMKRLKEYLQVSGDGFDQGKKWHNRMNAVVSGVSKLSPHLQEYISNIF